MVVLLAKMAKSLSSLVFCTMVVLIIMLVNPCFFIFFTCEPMGWYLKVSPQRVSSLSDLSLLFNTKTKQSGLLHKLANCGNFLQTHCV